jgi:hypothetical protein
MRMRRIETIPAFSNWTNMVEEKLTLIRAQVCVCTYRGSVCAHIVRSGGRDVCVRECACGQRKCVRYLNQCVRTQAYGVCVRQA